MSVCAFSDTLYFVLSARSSYCLQRVHKGSVRIKVDRAPVLKRSRLPTPQAEDARGEGEHMVQKAAAMST